MKLKSIAIIATIALSLSGCKTELEKFSSNYSLEISNPKSVYTQNDEIKISLIDDAGIGMDSIKWYRNAQLLKEVSGSTLSRKLANEPLGNITYKARIYKDGKITAATTQVTQYSNKQPNMIKTVVTNRFPHLTEAYTQGLEFYGDSLYESTGQYRESDLRITNPTTGEVIKKIELPANEFAEGMTILNNKIYQLTWRSNKGYVYDLNLNKLDEFRYNESKEGWGLTNDGKHLLKSDGSAKIWRIDPNTYEELGYIEVTSNDRRIDKINELEFVNGKIYCNVYQNDLIMVVNPENGAVESFINVKDLRNEIPNWDKDNNVLNGIAYRNETGKFYVTGKRWNTLFEIELQ
ncbi:glutaminyl-peptide cyclotransferase [Nonlabens sp. SY33080]|uniref:glutaminyl-peptide cyclotransferase n=1 Tax=Nonlabens sp. SY33080 TaxID=2719911 RepID=UPI0014289ED2|nr:glutaminyl-peptide cyclotransferase [Nonlabens sp. SY33080]